MSHWEMIDSALFMLVLVIMGQVNSAWGLQGVQQDSEQNLSRDRDLIVSAGADFTELSLTGLAMSASQGQKSVRRSEHEHVPPLGSGPQDSAEAHKTMYMVVSADTVISELPISKPAIRSTLLEVEKSNSTSSTGALAVHQVRGFGLTIKHILLAAVVLFVLAAIVLLVVKRMVSQRDVPIGPAEEQSGTDYDYGRTLIERATEHKADVKTESSYHDKKRLIEHEAAVEIQPSDHVKKQVAKDEAADKTPDKKRLTEHEAAVKIQSSYRAMKKPGAMKKAAIVKTESSYHDKKRVTEHEVAVKIQPSDHAKIQVAKDEAADKTLDKKRPTEHEAAVKIQSSYRAMKKKKDGKKKSKANTVK